MSNYTTNATVNLQMNGKESEQVLEELKTRAFDLQNAIAKAASEGKKALFYIKSAFYQVQVVVCLFIADFWQVEIVLS